MSEEYPFRLSKAQRIAECPGSVNATRGLFSSGKSSTEAEKGTRIHNILSAHYTKPASNDSDPKIYSYKNEEEKDAVNNLIRKTDSFISGLNLGAIKSGPVCEFGVEVEGWTGHPDFMCMMEDGTLVVIDWKSGRLAVEDSSFNAQLRGYAVAAPDYAKNDLSWDGWRGVVFAAIVQSYEPTTCCAYDENGISSARKELASWIGDALKPDAPRIPSESACRYCPACGTDRCRETKNMTAEIAKTDTNSIQTMDGDRLAYLNEMAGVVANIRKSIEKEIRFRIANGQAVGNCSIGKGKLLQSIENTEEAISILISNGVSQAEALSFCSISYADVKKKLGKDEAKKLIGHLVSEKVSAGSIVNGKKTDSV